MRNDQQQMSLRMDTESRVKLTPEGERELISALADLLIAVATANERAQNGVRDEHEDR